MGPIVTRHPVLFFILGSMNRAPPDVLPFLFSLSLPRPGGILSQTSFSGHPHEDDDIVPGQTPERNPGAHPLRASLSRPANFTDSDPTTPSFIFTCGIFLIKIWICCGKWVAGRCAYIKGVLSDYMYSILPDTAAQLQHARALLHLLMPRLSFLFLWPSQAI